MKGIKIVSHNLFDGPSFSKTREMIARLAPLARQLAPLRRWMVDVPLISVSPAVAETMARGAAFRDQHPAPPAVRRALKVPLLRHL